MLVKRDYQVDLRYLVEGALILPQLGWVEQFVRSFVSVEIHELADSDLAELVHELHELVLVYLDLVQVHVLRPGVTEFRLEKSLNFY